MQALATTNVNLGGSPRLTLHIEADTLPELMTAINAVMGGLDPARTEFVGFDEAMENTAPGATIHAHGPADAEAPKRGRGRPRKEDAAAPVEQPDPSAAALAAAAAAALTPTPPADAPVQVAPADPLAAAMAAQAAPTPAPAAAAAPEMQALSPADARKKAIEMVQAHFATHPDCLPAIQAISQKYGVTQFVDVPDADALRFLADITLLTNGTGEV